MGEIIDHKCYNYGHGIVAQNCFARQFSDAEFSIRRILTGTFVQVHSIQDDDVLFRIVHDDMQVEMNQMVCKKADIINVPENLWGPLFTVKKVARLSLVKDSKVAESIGNISVGHIVQVLGPDNTVICIASVTFRNSIGILGVGIYFGLRVLKPRENLQSIIKEVSHLEPGTKGFPRGCDIVVTVDKIRPSNCGLTKEKLNCYYDKELKKPLMKNLCSGEEVNSMNFKSVISYNLKDKYSNSCKKEKQAGSSETESNTNQTCLKKMMNSENPLCVEDEVVYLDGDTPERGVVKWIGLIENSLKVGVEFDNPITNSTGSTDGLVELFRTKYQHGLIVPPMALIKLSDYLMTTSKEAIFSKKTSNNNSNNNNNNNINTNNNLITNINNNNNNNNNDNNRKNINNNGDYCRSSEFYCDGKQTAEDSSKRSRKVSVSHQCLKHSEKVFETNDCFLDVNKEKFFDEKDSFKISHKSEGTFESGWQPISKSFDCSEPSERKISYKRNCSSIDNGLMQKDTNSCLNVQNPKSLSRLNRSSHDFCDLAGLKHDINHRTNLCVGKKLQKCSPGKEDDSAFFESSSTHSADKNSRTLPEKDLAKKSSRRINGDEIYDVPPCRIRKISGCEDFQFNFRSPSRDLCKRDKWGSHHSEHSSSDENLATYCDSSKPLHPNVHYPEDLGKGSVVELTFEGEPHYGVIKWIGTFPEEREDSPPVLIAGIEMEEEYPGFTDGTFKNKRYFTCNPKKALFVPLSKCRKDSRFLEESQKQNVSSKVNCKLNPTFKALINKLSTDGQIDCPIVEGTIPPICHRVDDIESICGKNRGIQGHHNSCYLDATLFAMFAFTSVFDSLLYRPPTKNDIPQYTEVQRVLRDEIVNPLRKNLYVRADRVMKLRRLLEELSSVSGLTSEEKDPEEFLNSLLAQILKAEPFLKLSSGQEAFHYQLFVEKDERLILPTVQQLFEQSFVTSDIKLKEVPSCLIIQMPRFGKSFKMYSKILPPQLLDVTDIIENSPRQCTVCGKLAEYECKDCFGQQGIGYGLESISYCKTCLDTAHNHHCRIRHNSRALTVPVEFYELQEHCIIPRLYMELFAVVCIETSHYVAFVKCGSGSDAPWCFFDSMADRKGEQNGYNIPEMVPCPDLPYWLSEKGAKTLNEMRDERQLTEHAKRLFSDAYMCMYQSPNLMMYR